MRKQLLFVWLLFTAISMNAQSPPSVSGDTNLCAGESTMLTASGDAGASFAWYDAESGGNLLSGTATLSINAPSTGMTFYVDQTVGGMTSARRPVYVSVTPNPNPLFPTNVLASPATICVGESSNLSASVDSTNFQSVHWYDAPTGGNLLGISDSAADFTVSPTDTTIYYAQSEVQLNNVIFNYTGSIQSFTVPDGIYTLDITANGARGGTHYFGGTAYGGRVEGTLEVTPGQTLNIYVGGAGGNYSGSSSSYPVGGWNGGGSVNFWRSSAGGGATDIRINGTTYNDRVIVAGGGGGRSEAGPNSLPHGGGLTGASGTYYNSGPQEGLRGRGGSQSAGGRRGCWWSGSSCGGTGGFGYGGTGARFPSGGSSGGGGGGGWYGGGGGTHRSDGGGGSSYTDPNLVSNVIHTQGANNGHGSLTISYRIATDCADDIRIPVTVNVNPIPVVTTSTDTYNCPGIGVSLSASGADSYEWMPGMLTGNNVTIDPNTTTTYTVTGSTDGCMSTESVLVSVSDVAAPADVLGCEGTDRTLVASGAVDYTWQPGNLSGASITVSPLTTTTYTVTGTDPSGCMTTDEVEVVVNPNPVVIAPPDSLIAIGTSIDLTASGTATSYTWNPGGNGTTITTSPGANTTYVLTGTIDSTTCSSTDTVIVYAIALPVLSGTGTILKNETTTLSATGPSGATFEWYDALTGGNLLSITNPFTTNPLQANTTIYAALNDGFNSSPRVAFNVTVIDSTLSNVQAADPVICPGASTKLTGTMVSPGMIDWYDAPSGGNLIGSSAVGDSLEVSPAMATTYYAQGRTEETTVTFNYTGSPQTFIVPDGVTSIEVDASGARGGTHYFGGTALGGRVQSTLQVSPGQTLNIYVGGAGGNYSGSSSAYPVGGWNGGGSVNYWRSSAGGGATDIRINGTTYNDRIIVAGGGGGRSEAGPNSLPHGGGLTGASGTYYNSGPQEGLRGRGGSQTAGGRRGCYWGGSSCGGTGGFGYGGTGARFPSGGSSGGGGGGGWYGGGGGTHRSDGGGGSSYTKPGIVNNVVHTQGYRNGHGILTITYSKSSTTSSRTATTVTVEDITPPVPDVLKLPDAMEEVPFNVDIPTATDACEGALSATTSDPTSYTIPGNYIINWEYMDASGNVSTQSQNIIAGGVLPVELTYFNVACENHLVRLEWETASENNSSHFNILRSNNEGRVWEKIDRITANVNTNAAHKYSTSVLAARGYSLFRLEQVDLDGSKYYSSIQQINCINEPVDISVFPNPTSGDIFINILQELKEELEIIIVDDLGKQLEIIRLGANNTKDRLYISLEKYPSGIYQFYIKGLDRPQVHRIVKLE